LKLEDLNEIPPWEWPEDAAALVLETLSDRNVSEEKRLLAAELAGDMVILDEEIAEALLSILQSNKEAVELRSQAAISLGPGLEEADFADYDDPDDSPVFSSSSLQKIQRSLHDLFFSPGVEKDLRRSVLEASVRNQQDWHAAAVKNAYASDDMDWRLTAVFCMQFVRGFDIQILEALKSSDPKIHFHAIQAAGNWELDAAWTHIAELITSPETEKLILLAAISAAASIRPHETEIIEPLVDSYDEDISEAAMDALAETRFAAEWDPEHDDEDDEDEDEKK